MTSAMRDYNEQTATARKLIMKLDGVSRDYGGGVTVGPVSCEIREGEFISLLGPSGCGKTTLLRTMAGFEPISSGRIEIDGRNVSKLPPHKRGVGFVFQNFALFPHLTVRDNVAFGLRLRKVPRTDTAARADEALRTVGLEHLAHRMPAQLSGGQQQRVAIARAIVLKPPILLLDEPLSSLDLKLRIQMRAELRSLQKKLGTTFIYVTHDQSEALALSDRIFILSKGHVAQTGTPAEIYQRPCSRFVADFVGTSNLIRILDLTQDSHGAVARLATGQRVKLPTKGVPTLAMKPWLCLRPEALRVLAADAAALPGEETLSGEVIASTFSGERTELVVQLDAIGETEPVTAVMYTVGPMRGRVRAAFDPASAVVVSDD